MFSVLKFYKYQGTGNDFVMIDNRSKYFKYDTKLIKRLCDRKFGIGADGLICLENSADNTIDFKMVYFNADGNESSMCGNGGRCIVAFARFLNIIESECIFEAIDGLHKARIDDKMNVELKMKDVEKVDKFSDHLVLDTGSPHYIKMVEDIRHIDVKKQGADIRYSKDFKSEGINVNFVQFKDNKLHIRTYERGVEDETLSCGTGVTAAALASYNSNWVKSKHVFIKAQGGDLQVTFDTADKGFHNIWLIGPTEQVFKGEILC
jgi:diaminopimelate epimerase